MTCPICCQPAKDRCTGCGARIERNTRGEADRALQQRDGRWLVVYLRRQNAHVDDDGPRRADLHAPNYDRYTIGADLEMPVGLDQIRTFGRFNFSKRETDEPPIETQR